jgi:hypothetical protein
MTMTDMEVLMMRFDTTTTSTPGCGGHVTYVTNRSVHKLNDNTIGKWWNVGYNISKDFTEHSIFIWYFAAVITLLVK